MNHRSSVVEPIFTDIAMKKSCDEGEQDASAKNTGAKLASAKSAEIGPNSNRGSSLWDLVRLWEIPPNGQGITALIALNILEHHSQRLAQMQHNSTDYLHLLVEAIRLAFADTLKHCADPECEQVWWMRGKGGTKGKERMGRNDF